ncbi:hypothetical protein ACM5Q9_06825 [Advenella sp. RU8]|uniref:hypothetical protein n=1 Tax=Advenella sp. RU8 TaxID=3399575 RepID=UPI003AAFA71D
MTKTRQAYTGHFYRDPHTTIDSHDTKSWITRAANFVVMASHAKENAILTRTAEYQNDEYFILLPEDTAAVISSNGNEIKSNGDSLFIAPPGDSQIKMLNGGWVYRIFSKNAKDLIEMAPNHQAWNNVTDVAELINWPAPVDGFKLRHYPLQDYIRTDTTMRLFRTCNLMVNIFLPSTAPRDIHKLSPHSHPDYEQGSLAVHGAYIHHLRYPWTPDLAEWREDDHIVASAPSLCVIPPNVIHTSQAVGEKGMRLVDIFAPPRKDFSLRPGLVCNEKEYPLPDDINA